MKDLGIGIVEGFFGPEWTWPDRHQICGQEQTDFYIYAPKRDSFLRKNWSHDHPEETFSQLKKLSATCHANKINFGVGLSPFEIHFNWDDLAKKKLREKILKLEGLGINLLGLFFDDMRGSPDLAERQCEIMEHVSNITDKTIMFCPTYYSYDPILDKVFGARPPNYLETIGANIHPDVHILWTGSKVISEVISEQDLNAVSKTLKRKPLVWDNYFANDGPRQCKFLSLKPFGASNHRSFEASSGWAFNLMNEPNLSRIVYSAANGVLCQGLGSESSFMAALERHCPVDLAQFIFHHREWFFKEGLDKLSEENKLILKDFMRKFEAPVAHEILDWLDGKYLVGAECLTD